MSATPRLLWSIGVGEGIGWQMGLETLWIDPVDKCNLECIMCSFKAQHAGKNTINLTDLIDLLGQARKLGVKNLNFGTTVEPTVYNELPSILNRGKELGFSISLITNLNFDNSRDQIFNALALIDNLYISIDAATKNTYEDIRKYADWSLLMRNLEKLGQFCTGRNVIARFAIQKKNIAEIRKFVDIVHNFRLFKEIVFDPVNIKLPNKHYELAAWSHSDLLLCKDELSRAYKKSKEYGLRCQQYLTVDAINKNETLLLERGYTQFLEGCFKYLYDARFPINNPCTILKSNLFISPKKQVFPCSGAYKAGELMLGDLNNNSLEEIWNSELISKLSSERSAGKRNGVCRDGCCTFEGQVQAIDNKYPAL